MEPSLPAIFQEIKAIKKLVCDSKPTSMVTVSFFILTALSISATFLEESLMDMVKSFGPESKWKKLRVMKKFLKIISSRKPTQAVGTTVLWKALAN
jgi:hypothetical protein